MDTERDENQNLKNDIDTRQDNSVNAHDTESSLKQNWYDDNELSENEHQENRDYADDQNNSSTGYTEKLLEKESDHNEDIENDLIVKNGISMDENADENNSGQRQIDNEDNIESKNDKDQ